MTDVVNHLVEKTIWIVVRGYDENIFGAHTTLNGAKEVVDHYKEAGRGGLVDKWRIVECKLFGEEKFQKQDKRRLWQREWKEE